MTEMTGPPPLVLRTRASEASPAKPLVIEVPGAADSTAVKKQPPTIFVLGSGERLEAQRFLLTATNLSFTVDRRLRTIPLDMLDISTTIAANRERGIDLRIPVDKNEISLSF
jgi:hypothetical protein